MTIRQQHVQREETVLVEVPVCDGCGSEVDIDDPETVTWNPDAADEEPVHTCPTCSIRDLSKQDPSLLTRRGRAINALRTTGSRILDARLPTDPENTGFTVFSALMAICTYALVPAGFSALGTELWLIASCVVGVITLGFVALDALSVNNQRGGGEALAALPLGGLIGILATSGGIAAWATLAGTTWLGAAYASYRYRLNEFQ